MTILAHNLYRLFALDLEGYSHQAERTLFEKFICNGGYVDVTKDAINIKLKKKRNLPLLLTAMEKYKDQKIKWLGNRRLIFSGASTS